MLRGIKSIIRKRKEIIHDSYIKKWRISFENVLFVSKVLIHFTMKRVSHFFTNYVVHYIVVPYRYLINIFNFLFVLIFLGGQKDSTNTFNISKELPSIQKKEIQNSHEKLYDSRSVLDISGMVFPFRMNLGCLAHSKDKSVVLLNESVVSLLSHLGTKEAVIKFCDLKSFLRLDDEIASLSISILYDAVIVDICIDAENDFLIS